MKSFYVLLWNVLCLSAAYAQPINDRCEDATLLAWPAIAACPAEEGASLQQAGSNRNAGPSLPIIRLSDPSSGAQLNAPVADVWYRFTAAANQLSITVEASFSAPTLTLFQATDCDSKLPIALSQATAVGNQAQLQVPTEPGQAYLLMVSGSALDQQGNFTLDLHAYNQCSTCSLRRGQFSASPAPVNGAYEVGQTVNFCYDVTMWDPGASMEWLHGLQLEFGSGWDQATLVPAPPAACTAPYGSWDWHDAWTSCNTGIDFGPGFAFDGPYGLVCPGGTPNDGLPGNNFGDGPCNGLAPAPLDLTFCWSVQVRDDISSGQQTDLSIGLTLLGDGYSGSWMPYSCESELASRFLATATPALGTAPELSVQQAACPGLCNGTLAFSGGLADSFALYDEAGQLQLSLPGPSLNTQVNSLCSGDYELYIYQNGQAQVLSVNLPALAMPSVLASYAPSCIAGEPHQLLASLSEPVANAAYAWTGPGGFVSGQPNTAVMLEGSYQLQVAINGCPLPVASVEVESKLPVISCEASTSSIVFSWPAMAEDTAYTVDVLSGQNGQWLSQNSYKVTGLASNETASILLTVSGTGDCPVKLIEQSCTALACPKPDAGPDTLLCQSTGLALSVDVPLGGSVAWTPSNGLSCTDCPNPFANPSVTTTYQVSVTNPAGCVGFDFVTVYVNELPAGILPEEPQTYCPGTPFQLCLPEENRYLWISPIGFIRTGNCLTYPYTTSSLAGTYRLQIRLPNGCRVSGTLELAIADDCASDNNGGTSFLPSGAALPTLGLAPNPARSQVDISSNMPGLKTLTLYRTDGSRVLSTSMDGEHLQLPLHTLSSGTYVVELRGAAEVERKLLSVVQ